MEGLFFLELLELYHLIGCKKIQNVSTTSSVKIVFSSFSVKKKKKDGKYKSRHIPGMKAGILLLTFKMVRVNKVVILLMAPCIQI